MFKASYTIKQASALSGISTAMIDYLCQHSLITPGVSGARPGRGRPRKFSYTDLVLLRGLKELLEAGLSVYNMKQAFKDFQDRERVTSLRCLKGKVLVTDGKDLFITRRRASALEDLKSGQLAFAFIIELEPIGHQLNEKYRELKEVV